MSKASRVEYQELVRRPISKDKKAAPLPTKPFRSTDPADPERARYDELLKRVRQSESSTNLKRN